MKKLLVALILALSITTISNAQPTYHDEYQNILLKVGYNYLNHNKIIESSYNTLSLEAEVLYSFMGSKVNLKAGKDYLSFSPIGILMFMPAIVLRTFGDLDPSSAGLFMLFAFSAMQIHIPVTDYIEITGGWDALKFTKLKNINDETFYCTGELNAGFNLFLTITSSLVHSMNTITPIMALLKHGIGLMNLFIKQLITSQHGLTDMLSA